MLLELGAGLQVVGGVLILRASDRQETGTLLNL